MATALPRYGSQSDAMADYFREGEARALTLGNRGPLRLGADGRLAPDIVEAYERVGFYVFEGAIAPAELAELEAGYRDLFDRLPAAPDSPVDKQGRPRSAGNRNAAAHSRPRVVGDEWRRSATNQLPPGSGAARSRAAGGPGPAVPGSAKRHGFPRTP